MEKTPGEESANVSSEEVTINVSPEGTHAYIYDPTKMAANAEPMIANTTPRTEIVNVMRAMLDENEKLYRKTIFWKYFACGALGALILTLLF